MICRNERRWVQMGSIGWNYLVHRSIIGQTECSSHWISQRPDSQLPIPYANAFLILSLCQSHSNANSIDVFERIFNANWNLQHSVENQRFSTMADVRVRAFTTGRPSCWAAVTGTTICWNQKLKGFTSFLPEIYEKFIPKTLIVRSFACRWTSHRRDSLTLCASYETSIQAESSKVRKPVFGGLENHIPRTEPHLINWSESIYGRLYASEESQHVFLAQCVCVCMCVCVWVWVW